MPEQGFVKERKGESERKEREGERFSFEVESLFPSN